MEATQMINDSILESDEEENEEDDENKRGHPLAKLCILKNEHIPEAEFPLLLGDNVLGRDPNTCTLPLLAPSVSKQHATISLSVYRTRGCQSEVEALVWDLGSLNGTRKGRLKLTSNVRYALSEGDCLVVADIPCQYVNCAADTVSSQRDTKTPVSRNSGVKARLPEPSREKGGDSSTGSKKSVNGGTKARVPLPDLQDTRRTPARTSCLSFEQTPNQPQGTLVPDSDSDGEKWGRGDIRCKTVVSDSDSYKSSPTRSTFLSPTNKIVPESEDESSITPSSSSKNRPCRHVSFSTEETDMNVGRQQLKEKKSLVIVDDSEEEERSEEERATPETKPDESGQPVPVNLESNASLAGGDKLSVFTPAVSTDVIAAFNMDSDTDVEDEEDIVASAAPVTLNTNKQDDRHPSTVSVHMDSDTDVDEENDATDSGPKSVILSDDPTKPPHAIPVIQPEGISMDSDTDVDDDDKAKPTLFQPAHRADSAPSTQPKDFHLDSDTDVDEEEEKECGTNIMCSEIGETSARLDLKPAGPESTDDEGILSPAISEQPVAPVVTCTSAGADLEILSDMEYDSPLVIPVAISTLSATSAAATQSDSDADTDMDESSMPLAGHGDNPADLGLNSDTDVEDKEAGDDQIPFPCQEQIPVLPVPLLQNCSTPVQQSDGEVEEMETQAFVSPSSGPFRCAPAGRPAGFSLSSDSQEDEDFVVAETQSFILQPRDHQKSSPGHPTQASGLESSVNEKDGSSSTGVTFQLKLSDSSHLQCQAQALAMESTQLFSVTVDGGVNLEETQAYADIMTADKPSGENKSYLEATQAYGGDVGCSVGTEKELHVDLALQATQAYISEPYSDAEEETADETQATDLCTSPTLAMAETQLMPAVGVEDSPTDDDPFSSVSQFETKEREAVPHEQRQSEALSIAETQPMCISNDEESDEEDAISGLRKRKAKPLQHKDEDTQPLTNSEASTIDTQPVETKVSSQLQRRVERLVNPIAETQPMCIEESDDEDSLPVLRKRKAKQLQPEEEETQALGTPELSAAETQPMGTGEDGESDDEDSIPGHRQRKAKPLQHKDEDTQPLTNSEPSAIYTQPVETKACLQLQRRAEIQSEVGTSGVSVRSKRAVRARVRKDKEEQAECSEPPKRQTGRKKKALPTSRGRRGKSRPDEDELEDEEEAVQTRGANSKRQVEEKGKHKRKLEEEQERIEMERKEKEEQRIRLEQERAEKERLERERKEQEEKEKADRIQKEKEQLERERKERERLEFEKAEREEKERLEREEKERMERERKEQEEKEKADRIQKEKEQLERERKERERLEFEKAEREEKERLQREEKERMERERKEQEEKEIADRIQKEKEQLERERKERERLEREEKERRERERREEKERLETAKRAEEERKRLEEERKEQEHQARLQMEEKERLEKEKQQKEEQVNKEKLNKLLENKDEKPKAPERGRRATRAAVAASSTMESQQESSVTTSNDCPARRTRSRSNSSNSVSSERSASSVNTQESRGRGRGRGAKRISEPVQKTTVKSSNRRRTAAAEPSAQITEQVSNDIPSPGVLTRSNSSSSLNSDISSCSVNSQSRGRGGRQRGRGRKTQAEPDSVPPNSSQTDQKSVQKVTARGRKSRTSQLPSNEDDKEKTNAQQPGNTTRGRGRANVNGSKPTAADEEDQSNPEEGSASDPSLLPQRDDMGKGQKTEMCEAVETPAGPSVNDGQDAKEKRRGRKRDLDTDAEEDFSSKTPRGKMKAQKTEAKDEETVESIGPVHPKRKGRATTTQTRKNTTESSQVETKEEGAKVEEEVVEKRSRSRPSMVRRKKTGEQEQSGTSDSIEQDANEEAPQPQTPTSSVSRKRQSATAASSPVPKTPRSSSVSPATPGRLKTASQAYKVLFTGVVDDTGENVLSRLGGSMAKTVADMNCLVTDKVRRTVKFLCAVAKGVPIVSTHWLQKSGKAGTFLSPSAYVVKDAEQENKFSFCLQESLRIASSQPLLQGYAIHVTKSVKPEPVHMKDIISCSGATFLPKMPSSHKPQTIVISCEEDWPLCGPAVSVSLPVVTAEFILTGILQQKLDFETHKLSGPAASLQPAGGRGRGRKKT